MLPAVIIRIEHQTYRDQDTGNNTGDEHIAYGDARHSGIYNHRNTRRDDNTKSTGDGNQSGSEYLVIIQSHQNRNRHTADSCYGCGRRSGQSTEEKAGNDNSAGKSRPLFSNKVGNKIEKLL